MKSTNWLFGVLILVGACWGMTIPLSKIAVSTDFPISGMIFWQVLTIAVISFFLQIRTGIWRGLKRRDVMMFLGVAALGTLFPAAIQFKAVQNLPAGIMAIVVALVPIFILPIALFTGKETFAWKRLFGVLMGLIAILLLVGPPDSLPDQSKAIFILLAILAPLSYAFEDNFIAYFGLGEMTPNQVLFGSSLIGLAFITPFIIITGSYFTPFADGWANPDGAMFASAVLHCFAYGTFIWMIGVAGPVFTGFVAYLVTTFGFIWSIFLLGEAHSNWIYAALMVMFVGMILVRPQGEHA